jgi:hypothetical protein
MTNNEYLEIVSTEHNKAVEQHKEINGKWSVEEILSAVEELLSK